MSIIIIGAGPNLGLAVARRFGREGLPVGLVARNAGKLDGLVEELEAAGVRAAAQTADIRDPEALTASIDALADRLGDIQVLSYSPLPAPEFMKPILDTSAEDIRGPLEVSVVGSVAAVQAALKTMRSTERGTILFTTGTAFLTLDPARAGVGVSFSGEVAYAQMLHGVLADEGIHVAHTAVNGTIGPGKQYEPEAIADVLWAHHVERREFQTRVGIK